jgi:hypothetical protein
VAGLLAVLLAVFASPALRAAEVELGGKISEVEARLTDDESVRRVLAFRQNVEKNAYQDTLKLCEGYRRARGLGPSAFHGSYMFSLDESLAAWAHVLGAGLWQPVSGMFGLKADYATLHRLKMLSLESWFGSVYALYLVHSLGFLQGAMHCLDSMDQREINLFAAAIVAADYEASLATQIAASWPSARVTSFLIKSTSYIWSPIRYLMRLLNLRLTKAHLIFGAAIVVPIATDNLFVYMNKMQAARDFVADLMRPDSTGLSEDRRQARIVLMATGLRVFMAEFDKGSGDYPEFLRWSRDHLTRAVRDEAHLDLADLSRKASLSDSETQYKTVLEAFLPILDQLNLP